MENQTDFINVAVRIRPPCSHDISEYNLKVLPTNPNVLSVSDRQHFSFDHIFDGEADQTTVFNDIIKPMVNNFLSGYSCTVFAYGQTGTGKTYTMGNPQNVNKESMGMIDRTFMEIFENRSPEMEIYTEVSLYEIYNEKVFDLLDDNKIPLPVKGFSVPGLKRVPVDNLMDAQGLFLIASKNRKTTGTSQNAKSSRSHAIYTLFCSIRNGDLIKRSKFNFVDLAGSESVRKNGSEGNTFHEGVNINKGLLCLGQVITALCSNQNYVPYRQAIITTILRDSLSKKNYITLIACVSSKITDTTETLQTLDFARRVKGINNKPEVYSVIDNSFKKPLLDMSKYFTPMKSMHPAQTSTAVKLPQPVPRKPSCTPSETPIQPMSVTMLQERAISISPIVRMCVAQIESKLSTTVSMLVNEKARQLLRRSSRTSTLHQCDKTVVDENDENIFKKQPRVDQNQNSVLKDITAKIVTSTENIGIMDNDRNGGNLKEINSSSPLFKIPVALSCNISRRRSKRINLKQTTLSPNTSADCGVFVKRLEEGQEPSFGGLDNVFDNQISPILAPVPRRSTRLSMRPQTKYVDGIGTSRCDHCCQGTKRSHTQIEMDEVPTKKTKSSKMEQHRDRVLKILKEGTLKSLTSLQTIGPKTAEKMLLYRQIHGKFETIEEVKNVLNRGQAYDRFMETNLLT